MAVNKDPKEAEEDESDDESIAEETSWFPNVAAKQISDTESSGTVAGDGICAIWICNKLSIDQDSIKYAP